jgi:predicted phosphodiesterase
MRILVMSDIHANLTALEAVLQDAGSVDAVWCLGDVVGYGPDPNECIERLSTLPNLVCLLGNHDAAALGRINLQAFNAEARTSIHWLTEILTPQSRAFLESLPEKLETEHVTLAHGSPRNPVWEYLLDVFTAAVNFDFFTTQLCFVGHTHLPMAYFTNPDPNLVSWKILHNGGTLCPQLRAILNPGSVGQPRDHNPLSAYALYEPDTNCWISKRVAYDLEAVQDRIRAAGLPIRHAQRLSGGW